MSAGEIRQQGKCGKCGREVLLITNSGRRTMYADGRRYIEPERAASGWNMFRCKCDAVIETTWVAVQPRHACTSSRS